MPKNVEKPLRKDTDYTTDRREKAIRKGSAAAAILPAERKNKVTDYTKRGAQHPASKVR